MPDRLVREKILTSESVNSLSWPAEVFYRRLMSIVDDYGRYDGRGNILRASLYPLKLDAVSLSDIVKWLEECSSAGLVRSYTVDGRGYIEILKFNQRLRAKKSKWPDPPNFAVTCQHMTADADKCNGDGRETNTEAEAESPTTPPPRFDSDSITTIESLAEDALSDELYFVEQLCRELKTTPEELKTKLLAFNKHLKSLGELSKRKRDYRQHFINWMRKQPIQKTRKMREI